MKIAGCISGEWQRLAPAPMRLFTKLQFRPLLHKITQLLSPTQPNCNPMLSLHLLSHSPRNSTPYADYGEAVVLSQRFRCRHQTQLSARFPMPESQRLTVAVSCGPPDYPGN